MAWYAISSTVDGERKNLHFAAKQSNQEQLRSIIMGRKKKKAELTRYR
jgi:hypothetical protein